MDPWIAGIIAGLISGIASPLLLSWLQHRVIWQQQKRLENKWTVFQDATRALSMWASDALDIGFQKSKDVTKEGDTRVVELRPETAELLERSSSLVRAFFSAQTADHYDHARRAHISLKNVPNQDFDQRRLAAIIEMAKELGLDPEGDDVPLLKRFAKTFGT